jgi:hypothetical protein
MVAILFKYNTLLNRSTFISYIVPLLRQATFLILRRKDPFTTNKYKKKQKD